MEIELFNLIQSIELKITFRKEKTFLQILNLVTHRTRKVVREMFLNDAPQISSLAWGGPKLDILYVTTANKDGKQPPGSGRIHKVTGLGTSGYSGVKVCLCH